MVKLGTSPKTNMEPKNGALEDVFPFLDGVIFRFQPLEFGARIWSQESFMSWYCTPWKSLPPFWECGSCWMMINPYLKKWRFINQHMKNGGWTSRVHIPLRVSLVQEFPKFFQTPGEVERTLWPLRRWHGTQQNRGTRETLVKKDVCKRWITSFYCLGKMVIYIYPVILGER